MAFEAYLEIKTIKSKVTAIGSNPVRRELVLGFEDGSVDTYDHETGNGDVRTSSSSTNALFPQAS